MSQTAGVNPVHEFVSYVAYCGLLTIVGMGLAVIWHDFSVAFHKAQHHSRHKACIANSQWDSPRDRQLESQRRLSSVPV
jgi:hypothetical protein